MPKSQIAKQIFLSSLGTMKSTLDLIAFKVDKKSEIYVFYKKEIMAYTYRNMIKLFKHLEENKIVEKCPNKCLLTQGYKKCKCGGSGYINLIEK